MDTPIQENEILDNVDKPSTDEAEPTDIPSEEFDEITYNGEAVKLPASERKTYLQKGYNYDKVKGKADTFEAATRKAAKLNGWGDDVDGYLAKLEEADRQEEDERFQQQYKEDPKKATEEVINSHPAFRKVVISESLKELEANKKNVYFKEFEKDIETLLKQTPNVNAQLAYDVICGQNSSKIAEIERKKAVEEHIRQSKRGTENSDGAPISEEGLDFTSEEKAWAERRVKQGTYKSIKEAWKWLRNK